MFTQRSRVMLTEWGDGDEDLLYPTRGKDSVLLDQGHLEAGV